MKLTQIQSHRDGELVSFQSASVNLLNLLKRILKCFLANQALGFKCRDKNVNDICCSKRWLPVSLPVLQVGWVIYCNVFNQLFSTFLPLSMQEYFQKMSRIYTTSSWVSDYHKYLNCLMFDAHCSTQKKQHVRTKDNREKMPRKTFGYLRNTNVG